jgi:hypothetical protein
VIPGVDGVNLRWGWDHKHIPAARGGAEVLFIDLMLEVFGDARWPSEN